MESEEKSNNPLIEAIRTGANSKSYNLGSTKIVIMPDFYCDDGEIYVICSPKMQEMIRAGIKNGK